MTAEDFVAGRLAGKRALVTGAAQGIGRAVAERFMEEGATVTAVDRAPISGLEGGECRTVDVTSLEQVQALAGEAGPVDILINAAAYVHVGTILDCEDAAWQKSFDTNVRGVHYMMQAFLPGMIPQGHGVIANVASTGGSIKAIADRYVYAGTKAAVIGLTKAVAADFIGSGIRANAICPGTIDSPSLGDRIAAVASRNGVAQEQVRRDYAARQPMGRLGTPDEIAWLAVFLCSDEGAFCTGQAYIADGGYTM